MKEKKETKAADPNGKPPKKKNETQLSISKLFKSDHANKITAKTAPQASGQKK